MKLLKKITQSELNNSTPAQTKALVDGASGEPVFICRIIGLVRGQEVVNTPHGTSIKFKGEFRGWGRDSEVAMAPVAYFPAPFDELLSQQINDAKGDDGGKNVTVEFGLEVYAVPDKGTVGYKFIVKPLKEAAASDPLAALEASFAPLALPAATPAAALPAPEAAASEATDEAAAPAGKGGKK